MTSCGRATMAFNRKALAAADDGSPDTSFKEEAGPERTMSYIVGLSAKEDAERMEKKEKMKKQLTLHEKGVINPQRSRVMPYAAQFWRNSGAIIPRGHASSTGTGTRRSSPRSSSRRCSRRSR